MMTKHYALSHTFLEGLGSLALLYNYENLQ